MQVELAYLIEQRLWAGLVCGTRVVKNWATGFLIGLVFQSPDNCNVILYKKDPLCLNLSSFVPLKLCLRSHCRDFKQNLDDIPNSIFNDVQVARLLTHIWYSGHNISNECFIRNSQKTAS